MSVDLAAEVDWSMILAFCDAGLRQLSSYKAAENEMRSDNQVARHLDTMVGDGQVMMRVDIHTCLSGPLYGLLVDQKDAFFNEEKFNRIYREMEGYFYGDTLRRRVIASLTDFEMDAETIALGDGLSIIRLARAEREEFASQALMFPLPPFGSYGPTGWEEFALELHIEVPKVSREGCRA